MSTDFEFPQFRRSAFRLWKRWLIVAAVVAVALLIAVVATWNTFFEYVPPGKHLVIISKDGEPLPARRDDVVPRVGTPARPRDDVVQVLRAGAAVLTGPLVAGEDRPAREGRVGPVRDLHEGPQPQDGGRVDVQVL